MDDAIIEITDHFTIYDLDVALNIKHTNAPDLHIFIQGPSGKRIYLNKYESTDFPEGKHPNYDQTIFDDEAAVPIEEAESPFTGRFRPLAGNQLNIFDGDDVFGTWRLQIHDAHYDDIGNLESFELMVTIPEPATVTLFSFSTMIVLLRNSRRLW
jgi:subtilisin-like proprotein convertase family protein